MKDRNRLDYAFRDVVGKQGTVRHLIPMTQVEILDLEPTTEECRIGSDSEELSPRGPVSGGQGVDSDEAFPRSRRSLRSTEGSACPEAFKK